MTNTLTWLHLSDFHFKADTDWQQDVVLNPLMRDVIEKLPELKLHPDMVVVTGDIANHGKAEEYKTARRFFDRAAKALDHDPKECWFLVPGNHDVDRSKIKAMQKVGRKNFEHIEVTDELLSEPETWVEYAKRQTAFFNFTDTFLGPDREWHAQTPWRTDSLTVGHIHIAVLCLNSAWLAQDDKDEGNLLISEYQACKALAKAKDAHLRMALFHHPLSWLRKFDQKKVHDILAAPEACHVLLNGHLHDTKLALQFSPGSQIAQLAAGACWQGSNWPHSVTVGQLDFEKRLMHLHVFSYSDNEGGFWKRDNQLSRNMPNGVWTEPFPRSWTFPKAGTTPIKQNVPLIPQTWRKHLQTQCGHMDALVEMENPRPCKLDDIYVSLKTGWREPEKRDQPKDEKEAEESPRRPLEILAEHLKYRHFAVVGGPGAGKTTFVRHMALSMLNRENPLLPLLLPLKDFGAWLKQDKGNKPDHLIDWAQEQLEEHGLKDLSPRIGQGQVLWLLDGLDEIFDEKRRLQAVKIIHAVTRDKTLGADRLLLTTRPHALDKPVVRQSLGLGDQTAHILDLDPTDQRVFITGWFKALYPEDPDKATERRDDLWQKLTGHDNLARLRGTPLLLSMIAAIYHLGSSLPERRSELYDKAVTNLLERRYGLNARTKGSPRLVREMRRALMTTALWMMEHDAVRELGEVDFVRALGKESFPAGSPDWNRWAGVEDLAMDLGAHSGLLTMQKKSFRFIHLGFQEYLAALAVVYKDDIDGYLAPRLADGKWREVILLTVGILYESQSSVRRGEKLIRTILAQDNPCRSLAMAVEAAAQAPSGELRALEKELTTTSLEIIRDTASPHGEKDRCELGLALGHLGDPRLGLMWKDNWIELTIPDGRTYRLAKYLTTNQDFKAFIQRGGYTEETWWDEEGRAWLEKEMPDADNRYPTRWWDKNFNAPNQPVVGVSWHEVRAFCRWLTAALTGEGWLPEKWEVRLPNNVEWDHAVGEGRQKYPWGNEKPDETRANYDRRLNQTSPVGLYPNGVAGGVHDLGGNVWEWNLDLKSEGVPFRRGGSWDYPSRLLASSFRYGYRAGYRFRYLGFRCCLAPRALES